MDRDIKPGQEELVCSVRVYILYHVGVEKQAGECEHDSQYPAGVHSGFFTIRGSL